MFNFPQQREAADSILSEPGESENIILGFTRFAQDTVGSLPLLGKVKHGLGLIIERQREWLGRWYLRSQRNRSGRRYNRGWGRSGGRGRRLTRERICGSCAWPRRGLRARWRRELHHRFLRRENRFRRRSGSRRGTERRGGGLYRLGRSGRRGSRGCRTTSSAWGQNDLFAMWATDVLAQKLDPDTHLAATERAWKGQGLR
jgi:hypothetical protein